MKERPILFSAPMMRAILAGKKTQTRRVVKPQPPGLWMKPETAVITDHHGCWAFSRIAPNGMAVAWPRGANSIRCPYGVPGDRLWVRETWFPETPNRAIYRADGEFEDGYAGPGWRPSIHMPRWASRIILEVTDVRVERVQAITEEDAKAEGVPPERAARIGADHGTLQHTLAFAVLWDSINAPRGFGWATNPWVWCLTFKRVLP